MKQMLEDISQCNQHRLLIPFHCYPQFHDQYDNELLAHLPQSLVLEVAARQRYLCEANVIRSKFQEEYTLQNMSPLSIHMEMFLEPNILAEDFHPKKNWLHLTSHGHLEQF